MGFTESKFKANLDEVKRADLAIVELFKKRGNEAYLNPATDYEGLKRGDVIVNGMYIENKVDFESMHTGNICVEAKSLDRNNDWFGYVVPQYYVISRPKLKVLTGTARQVIGGDAGYKLFLIPKLEFLTEAQLLNP